MKKKNLIPETGVKSILLSIVFFLFASTSPAQKLTTGDLYLGQTPPGNAPKAFPLKVNEGFFPAERIVISNDGKDIYYSEIKSYYPIRGENIKRYTFATENGPAHSICSRVMPRHFR